MARKVIDPITRIEGHLRVEVEVEGGAVKNAWSSGTMFRGIEIILIGRDPRDAGLITQRNCGVCTHVHYDCSIYAVENAIGIKPPRNARIVRNLIKAAQLIQDHIIHFYILHGLDFVDVTKVLDADPKKAFELGMEYGSTYNLGIPRLKEVKKKVEKIVKSGQLGPFANGYWGHPAYKLPPEGNLLVLSHYLDALEVQRLGGQILAILGGKEPHTQTLVVGGVTCIRDILDPARLKEVIFRFRKLKEFVDKAYLPDLIIAGEFYKDEALEGIGKGCGNYMVFGDFPLSDDLDMEKQLFVPGVIRDFNLGKVEKLDPMKIEEFVKHSWYEYPDDSKGLHPFKGITAPHFTGLNPDGSLKVDGKYSWIKAPRYDGRPMEVGPLARVLVAYARGVEAVRKLVDGALRKLNLPLKALFSTIGRTAARCIETKWVADSVGGWINELVKNLKVDDSIFTRYEMPMGEAKGYALKEAPRGSLSHWVKIENGKIKHYQCVVPSTWNLSPRDAAGNRGPLEEALIGTPVYDVDQPLEVLRTVHSFDPCLACAIHIFDRDKGVKVRTRMGGGHGHSL